MNAFSCRCPGWVWMVCLGSRLIVSAFAAEVPEVSLKNAAEAEAKWAADERAAEAFFNGPIQQFEVNIDPEQMKALRRDARNPVPARVRVGTNVFESVAVHVKGSAGSRRGIDEDPALTLNFDKLKPGQLCHGLAKLHLNNSVQDRTFANENLASRIYLKAGIPTARASHAFVKLNGRDMGLYVLKEGYGSAFVRRHFPQDRKGNLYDGGFVRDIDQDLKLDYSRGVTNLSDLRALNAAMQLPPSARRAKLPEVLDVERFITYAALQCLMDDWDGYPRNRNNYRVYIDSHGRATFIPHGMDQLFQDVNRGVRGGWNGQVAISVFELGENKARLRERMDQLLHNEFSKTNLMQGVERIRERLRAACETARPEIWRHVEANLRGYQSQLIARYDNALAEVQAWPKPMKPAAPGARFTLGEWQRMEQSGRPLFDAQPPRGETNRVVHIIAKKDNTLASYRAPATLPPGNYRFTCRVKTRDLVPISDRVGIGAGVRISHALRENSLSGTKDWTELAFDFTREEADSVEMVLELRAKRGEAWFDLDSIVLQAQ